jgi:dienelactone hydrolase
MGLRRVFVLGVGVAALLSVSLAGRAQLVPGQSGVIYFNSVNVNGLFALAMRQYDPTPVQIFGTLLLPADLSAKVPAMVVKHGSVPPSEGREFEWAEVLNGWVIEHYCLYSFTPRGIGMTATDQSVLSTATDLADALKALELLATHPNIDANRIGIMGGSRGGYVAALTTYEEVRQGVINGDLKFAAHISFYPPCNNRCWSPNLTGVPLLYLLAQLDDYNPALPCTKFTQLLASLGADVTTIVYPDAHHGFDSGRINAPPKAPTWYPDFVTGRNCALETRLDTWVCRRYDTGQVFATEAEIMEYLESCQTRGVTVGANAVAEAQAVNDVRIFLARVFHLANVSLPASQPDRIFNWAQDACPQYFQPRGTQSQTGFGYYYRCYVQTGACVGIRDGRAYYLVPAIDPNTIFDAGAEAPLLDIAIQAGY